MKRFAALGLLVVLSVPAGCARPNSHARRGCIGIARLSGFPAEGPFSVPRLFADDLQRSGDSVLVDLGKQFAEPQDKATYGGNVVKMEKQCANIGVQITGGGTTD